MIMCMILSLPGLISLNKIDKVCKHMYFTIQSYIIETFITMCWC